MLKLAIDIWNTLCASKGIFKLFLIQDYKVEVFVQAHHASRTQVFEGNMVVPPHQDPNSHHCIELSALLLSMRISEDNEIGDVLNLNDKVLLTINLDLVDKRFSKDELTQLSLLKDANATYNTNFSKAGSVA